MQGDSRGDVAQAAILDGALARRAGDDARAEAVLAELLALPLTGAQREGLADLLPDGDARGLGTEQ